MSIYVYFTENYTMSCSFSLPKTVSIQAKRQYISINQQA